MKQVDHEVLEHIKNIELEAIQQVKLARKIVVKEWLAILYKESSTHFEAIDKGMATDNAIVQSKYLDLNYKEIKRVESSSDAILPNGDATLTSTPMNPNGVTLFAS